VSASRIPERETKYVKTDGGYVGYQVFGSGPLDLLFIPSWSQNIDVMWQEPSLARYLDRLASFARVICFNNRGSGVSDPVPIAAIPSLDAWMDDVRAVLDAAGARHAAILGEAEGGPVAILFAATFPDRVSSLVLVNSFARWKRADDYPIGMPPDTYTKLMDQYEGYWGQDADMLALTAPSMMADARFRSWFTTYQRLSMAPGYATAFYRWITGVDVRHVLASVRTPTLVIHRSGNLHHRVAYGRYLADRIERSEYVELDGADSYPFHAGDFSELLDKVEEFLTGDRQLHATDRTLATVLFTDIVGSTDKAAQVGDEQWLDLLQVHDRLTAEHVERFRGEIVNHTGDGVLATFDGPARAVTCGLRLCRAMQGLGLDIRVGMHTGEIEKRNGQVGGIAVHIAARVMSRAPDGGVAVSSTVKDLVTGSGFSFRSTGTHQLKGVPGQWAIYEVAETPDARRT
jgi:class 3 adenylate cyclase